MAIKLSRAALTNIDKLNTGLSQVVSGVSKPTTERIRQKIGRAKTAELKQMAREIIKEVGPTNRAGFLTHPVDKAITSALRKNQDKIRKDIISLIEKKGTKIQPIDYYRLYYDALSDSGLLNLIDPKRLEKYMDLKMDPSRASACDTCSLCNACSACAACGACAVSIIEGTVGTGVVGATVGTGGYFF